MCAFDVWGVAQDVNALSILSQSPATAHITAQEFAAACRAAPPPPPPLPPCTLPSGWGRAQTRGDHHEYYFHPASGVAQWTHPATVAAEVRCGKEGIPGDGE